jgi:hypothetical protein
MNTSHGSPTFERDVFPTELDEIRRRRLNADDPRPLADGSRLTVRHGLVGLAFSGGGIRSSAFSLGVAQQFIASGLWSTIDFSPRYRAVATPAPASAPSPATPVAPSVCLSSARATANHRR